MRGPLPLHYLYAGVLDSQVWWAGLVLGGACVGFPYLCLSDVKECVLHQRNAGAENILK